MSPVIQLDYTVVLVNLSVMFALSKTSIYARLLSRAPGAPQSPEGSPGRWGCWRDSQNMPATRSRL